MSRMREVEYKMTLNGPKAIELNPKDIDFEHYQLKQMAPIADMILQLEKSSLNDLLEGGQLSLFSL